MGVGLTYAYFTARASSAGELFFANICADFVTSDDQVYTTDLFNQQLGKIKPGYNFKINTIYLKNTGEYDVYALLEVTFNAFKSGSTTASYTSSTWYNLSGVELTGDKSTTTVEATLVKMNTKTITTINLTVPEELDNEYKSGTATLNIKAHVIQSLLQAETGVGTAVTASRLIYQNKDNADVEHTVYIRPNGGTYNNTTETTTISQDRGSTITLTTPTREGYTFKSWSFTGDGSLNGSTYTFGKSVGSITAEWQANTYNVTFDYNNGTNPNILDTSLISGYEQKYDFDTNVVKAVYHDGNQYTNSKIQFWKGSTYLGDIFKSSNSYKYSTFTIDGSFDTISFGFNGNKYDSKIYYNLSSLAQGETYTLSFKDTNTYPITTGEIGEIKLEKGSVRTGYTAPIKSVEYDATYGTLPTPTREGYTFNGWYKDFSTYSGGSYTLNGYYAQISTTMPLVAGNKYTLRYNYSITDNTASVENYGIGIGYGERYYSKDIIYSDKYTTLSGEKVVTFTAPENSYLMLRPIRYGSSTGSAKIVVTDFSIVCLNEQITSSTQMETAQNHTLIADWTKNTSTQSEEQSVEALANIVDIYFEDKKAYAK